MSEQKSDAKPPSYWIESLIVMDQKVKEGLVYLIMSVLNVKSAPGQPLWVRQVPVSQPSSIAQPASSQSRAEG